MILIPFRNQFPRLPGYTTYSREVKAAPKTGFVRGKPHVGDPIGHSELLPSASWSRSAQAVAQECLTILQEFERFGFTHAAGHDETSDHARKCAGGSPLPPTSAGTR
jgi:hypothetical protein